MNNITWPFSHKYCSIAIGVLLLNLFATKIELCQAQSILPEGATVSALGRTGRVNSNGSFTISGVPANLGMFRIRLVSLDNQLAQSACVLPIPFGITIIPPLDFLNILPVPVSLTVTSNTAVFQSAGQTGQLTVIANYQGGSTGDLTADTCTNYLSSNPAVVTVNSTGQLLVKRTPVSQTPVTITVLNEGAVGTVTINIKPTAAPLSYFESFENGIPAGWTISTSGVGGTSGAAPNIGPTDGVSFCYIDNRGSTSTKQFSGTAGTTLLSAPITLGDGSILSMDLNFMTNDGGGFNDFAFVQLLDATTGSVIATLYDANTSGQIAQAVPSQGPPAPPIDSAVMLSPAGAFFDGILTGPVGGQPYGPTKYAGGPGGSTGWINTSYKVMGGTYRLFFVVSCFGDTSVKSGLAIDNIQATIPK